MSISPTVIDTIGATPLVRLNHVTAGLRATVAVKLESRNPSGSIKDRVGWSMVRDAEHQGLIERHRSVLIEPTSGNTGIALAMVGAALGYRVILTMPESMSQERRTLLAAYGAKLVLTPRERGMAGAVEAANELAAKTPHAFIPAQFDNPANAAAHYATTGPEIVTAVTGMSAAQHPAIGSPGTASPTPGTAVGAFVAAVGTGGTITGVGRYLRDHGIPARIVAVEPTESPIISQKLAGKPLTPAAHGIQGIGANFIPCVLDLNLLDEVQHVSTPEAIAMSRRLAAEEGLLVGISSGANVVAALRLAERPEFAGTTIVTVAPSTGERYLTTPLWQGLGG